MTVKRTKWFDKRSGTSREFWMVDVDVVLPSGERVRQRKTVRTKTEGDAYERELRRKLLDGAGIQKEEPKIVPTLRAFGPEFIEKYAMPKNKRSEIESKRSILALHLYPAFGDLPLDRIRGRVLADFVAAMLGRGSSRKSVNNCLAVLSKVLNVAVSWEVLSKAPRLEFLKTEERERDFFQFDELDRLLAAAREEPAWYRMILVAAKTGLRRGELRALQRADVDLGTRRLHVRHSADDQTLTTPKNWERRELDLTPSAHEALREQLASHGRTFVFPGAGGELLTCGAVKWPLWRICDRAGLRRVQWHVLRHTFASHLAMKGVPMFILSKLLGHKDVATTMRYAHLAPAARGAAIHVLDEPMPRTDAS